MADDDARPASKGSKFLKKSKWGKIFKEDDSAAPGRPGAFKLNEDVVDFLKPSTEKQVPKLDIAIAKRWPDAHEVRNALAGGNGSPGLPPFGYAKPKRRKGLTVTFAKSPPQIIGEGGDESLEPTSEISRKRAMLSRSISEKTPAMLADGTPWPGSSPPVMGGARSPPKMADSDSSAPSLRRALTSHYEFSPALQAKMSPAQQDNRFRASGRTAADVNVRQGYNQNPQTEMAMNPGIVIDSAQDQSQTSQYPPPGTNPDFDDIRNDPSFASQAPYARGGVKKQYLGLAPGNTASPVYRKSRDMSLSEGMAFRRASSMIFKDDDEDNNNGQDVHATKPPFQQSPLGKAQPAPAAREIVSDLPRHQSRSESPPSAISPSEPSPFDDPKYIKRHSREVRQDQFIPSSQGQPPVRARQLDPAPSEDPRYIKNFSRGVGPPPSQPNPLNQPHEKQTSYQQGTAQNQALAQSRLDLNQQDQPRMAPQLQHPAQRSQPPPRPPRLDSQPEYGRATADYGQTQTALGEGPIPQQPTQMQQPHHGGNRVVQMPVGNTAQAHYRTNPPQIVPPQGQDNSNGQRQTGRGLMLPQTSPQESSLAPLPDRSRDSSVSSHKSGPLLTRPNGSSSQLTYLSSRTHSRNGSQDDFASGRHIAQQPPSPRFPSETSLQTSPRSLAPGQTNANMSPHSPDSRTSPGSYFNASRGPAAQSSTSLRREESRQQSTAAPVRDDVQASPSSQVVLSPTTPSESNPAADAAFSNFARRVSHMKGVFRLTAEKEQPAERCTPSLWARAALWWFLRGKSGLEALVQQRRSQANNEPHRELLTQAHVDVAKAWWIVTDPLAQFQPSGESLPSDPEASIRQTVSALHYHLKSISLSMGKAYLMPPTDSLIQGQDTSIWLQYPRFAPDAAAVLGGPVNRSVILDQQSHQIDAYEMIPLGDSRDSFCYGRFRVDAYLNTEDADSDRIPLPCILSIVRNKYDYQTSVIIASQNELVNIRISPRQDEKRGLTWQDVTWRTSSSGFIVRLPHAFDLSVGMQERDFKAAWNLIEYARRVDDSVRPEQDESLVYDVRLTELHYVDSNNRSPFAAEKIRGCKALVFEHSAQHTDGSGTRKMHRGFRLLLITDPGHKTLTNVSHDICRGSPFFFEFMTDTTANGTVAMTIRVPEQGKQSKILMVFPDTASRQYMYDVLIGLRTGQDETIVGRMTLTGYNIEPATQTEGFTTITNPTLQALQWQKLGVTNRRSDDQNSRIPPTVESENLRIVTRHTHGCITDRLNLGKGELLLRLPCIDKPTVQVLRQPQEDMAMSIDIRNAPPPVVDGIGQLLNSVISQPTIRTFTFATPTDLHNFQVCITGFSVRFDGLASSFGISRRRMVVPIYKKWEASNVRVQVVAKESVVQVLAFMEDFSHADAMCFQVKSMDTFEKIKGKWALRIVDAKFSLPQHEKGEVEGADRVKRRFANLEGLDYAEEHDDITIGFNTEADRDAFAQALPGEASVARGITLKRRI